MTYKISDNSSFTEEEAAGMIGKTVKSIEACEYSMIVRFTDDTELCVGGATYGDCSMDADYG